MRYKILHNRHDKESRDFVSAFKTKGDVIDWYDDEQRQAYLDAGGLIPSQFPCVFDSNKSVITEKVPDFQSGKDRCAELSSEPVKNYRIERMREYLSEGLTVEAWTMALIESQIDNDNTSINEMKSKRQAIKQKHPKPSQP